MDAVVSVTPEYFRRTETTIDYTNLQRLIVHNLSGRLETTAHIIYSIKASKGKTVVIVGKKTWNFCFGDVTIQRTIQYADFRGHTMSWFMDIDELKIVRIISGKKFRTVGYLLSKSVYDDMKEQAIAANSPTLPDGYAEYQQSSIYQIFLQFMKEHHMDDRPHGRYFPRFLQRIEGNDPIMSKLASANIRLKSSLPFPVEVREDVLNILKLEFGVK